jgi:beta-glucosidase
VVQQAEKKRSTRNEKKPTRNEKKRHEEVVADPLQPAYDAAGSREWALGELSDRWKEAEERAQKLLGEISMDDKLALLHGQQTESGYAGYVHSGGIPGAVPLRMNDGPQGFNPYTEEANQGTTTQFPCLLAVAATFDPEASRRYANAIAEEFVGKGANVLLGPDVEVLRVAVAGRSFETLSGEDPYLGSQLVKPFVQAVQDKGIIATVKHWLNNNQEVMRMTMSVEVGDRAQHEIYTPVFKAAFEAGAAAVMCSYNKVYGTYACENDRILKQLLRDDLGYRGLLMSDWEATHDAKASANGGLDVEMPTGANFAELQGLVGSGEVSEETIDAMAGHVLASMYFTGQFDGKFEGEVLQRVSFDDVTSDEHREVAKQTIVDSAVLVKNRDSTLPIETKGKKIAMIGKYCKAVTWESDYMGTSSPFMAGGSGYVTTTRTIPPLKALQDLVQDAESIEWSEDASAGEGADIAIICTSDCDAHEGWDRPNFTLPEAAGLVKALKDQGGDKKVVMLAIVPGEVTTEWIEDTDAALFLFMPGEQVGPATADLLTGVSSPGGRLPISLPNDGEKPQGTKFTDAQYPGTCGPPDYWCDDLVANFSEGVLIGYRWYDASGIKPKYPFGFGLTYTDFEFAGFDVVCSDAGAVVSLQVKNVGGRDGAAVPQLYVGFASLKPLLRQIRGFQKVQVPAGKSVPVTFVLTEEDWKWYDESTSKWRSASQTGEQITISVGSSSGDLIWNKTLACA